MKRSDIPTRAVLEACHRFHNRGNLAPLQILMNEFNAPEKVVYSAMERDLAKEFIDYGVSLRTAWVTPEGYKFLEKIEANSALPNQAKKP